MSVKVKNTERLLAGIATDSETVNHCLETQLTSLGFRCISYHDPDELINSALHYTLNVLFLSTKFHGRHGKEICQSIPRLVEQHRVVLVSSEQENEESDAEPEAEKIEMLRTPIEIPKLVSITKAIFPDSEQSLSGKGLNGKGSLHHNGAIRVPELNGKSQDADISDLAKPLVGQSADIRRIRDIVVDVAPTKATVMVSGESGTGKEVVARAIHQQSGRTGLFVPVNMAALPSGLAESLIFGHEHGAFTGAVKAQPGFFEMADGGTLFLDEICDMDLYLQPKLLRCLQEGAVQRIGSQSLRKVDVRIITATNRDAKEMVRGGGFREDLYYRLHVVPIHVPPLRNRPEDIEQLANVFLQKAIATHSVEEKWFAPEAIQILKSYNWPGNVRQLENTIERLVIFSRNSTIDASEFSVELQLFDNVVQCGSAAPLIANEPSCSEVASSERARRLTPIQQCERAAIIDALEHCGGHVIQASRYLGLGQATMYRRIKQYAINRKCASI